jgi:hypothetical protein
MQKIFFIISLFFNILILFSQNKLFSMLQIKEEKISKNIYLDPKFPKHNRAVPINKPKNYDLLQSIIWSQSPQNINYEK